MNMKKANLSLSLAYYIIPYISISRVTMHYEREREEEKVIS